MALSRVTNESQKYTRLLRFQSCLAVYSIVSDVTIVVVIVWLNSSIPSLILVVLTVLLFQIVGSLLLDAITIIRMHSFHAHILQCSSENVFFISAIILVLRGVILKHSCSVAHRLIVIKHSPITRLYVVHTSQHLPD